MPLPGPGTWAAPALPVYIVRMARVGVASSAIVVTTHKHQHTSPPGPPGQGNHSLLFLEREKDLKAGQKGWGKAGRAKEGHYVTVGLRFCGWSSSRARVGTSGWASQARQRQSSSRRVCR